MAEADHAHEEEAEPAQEEEAGHGHGEAARIGYIGTEPGEEVDEHELEEFRERVTEEAFAKAQLDKIRFVVAGLFFVLAYLAFAKIPRVSERLRTAIDWYTLGTVSGIILSKARKTQVGEILFYAGVFSMIAISYWAAAGEIIPHIFPNH